MSSPPGSSTLRLHPPGVSVQCSIRRGLDTRGERTPRPREGSTRVRPRASCGPPGAARRSGLRTGARSSENRSEREPRSMRLDLLWSRVDSMVAALGHAPCRRPARARPRRPRPPPGVRRAPHARAPGPRPSRRVLPHRAHLRRDRAPREDGRRRGLPRRARRHGARGERPDAGARRRVGHRHRPRPGQPLRPGPARHVGPGSGAHRVRGEPPARDRGVGRGGRRPLRVPGRAPARRPQGRGVPGSRRG